jgi:SagB-type dehydrogenase family enzyme
MTMQDSVRTLISLHREVSIMDDRERSGGMILRRPNASGRLGVLSGGVRAAMDQIAAEPAAENDLLARVIETDGHRGALGWQKMVHKLATSGLLERSVCHDGRVLATLRPIATGPIGEGRAPEPEARIKLSRFATARAVDAALLVETPLSHLGVQLSAAATPLLSALARGGDAGEMAAKSALPQEAVTAVLGLFETAALLVTGEHDPEVEDRNLAQWSTVDLWQHRTSRGGGPAGHYGGTYPFKDQFEPLPAIAPAMGQRRVRLEPVDAPSAADTLTLTEALENRRSVRVHDDESPLTLDQLGELLYRSVRTKSTFPMDGDEGCARPYPAGGALHELEIYPVVTSCAGIEPGVWHYAAAEHALEFVEEPGEEMRALVEQSRAASLMESAPQVVLVVTARFGRVLWKYEGMGYALILKHVGVLYQTLYLVATAMGLGACGLGGGHADTFARATGIPALEQGSVGEFVIGSPGEDPGR